MQEVVIVGGGITGLAAAYRLRQRATAAGHALRCTVIEERSRLGGKILTHRRDGFVAEGGPDAFVPHKPWLLALVRELGLEDRLIPSNDRRRGMSFVVDGRLVPLPEGMAGLVPTHWGPTLRSPLLGWGGKLRLWTERWRRAKATAADESVAAFVRRRCGREVLERIAEPLLASIHVGDVERMSLAASAPRLAALERRHGSLTRGLRAAADRKREGPLFWSLHGGMAELIDGLVKAMPDVELVQGQRVTALERGHDDRGGWQLTLGDGARRRADGVLLAVPAAVASSLIGTLAPVASAGLERLRTASVAVVSLGFPAAVLEPVRFAGLEGFGFFVPRREGCRILAVTWTSSKFDQRAPAGHVLLRAFVGGAHDEAIVEAPEDELLAIVESDVRDLLKIADGTSRPSFTRVQRWRGGYPQYDVGHAARVAAIEAALPPSLAVAGSPFHGVGMADCVHSAERACDVLWGVLEGRWEASPAARVG